MTIEKLCKKCHNVYMAETEEIDFIETYGEAYSVETQCPICDTLQNVYIYVTDDEKEEE